MRIFGLLFTFFFPGVLVGMGLMYGYQIYEVKRINKNNDKKQ